MNQRLLKKTSFLAAMGSKIKAIRQLKGLSLRQLAAISHIDHSDLQRVEQGKVNIGIFKLLQLAEALQVEKTELIRVDSKIEVILMQGSTTHKIA